MVCGFILPEEGPSRSKEGDFKLLCAQRPEDAEHFPSLYEFIGGKVDLGETHYAALIREIKEELDVEVEIVQDEVAFHFNHAPKQDKKLGGQVEFRLFFYWVRLIRNRDGSNPAPKALASQKVTWLTPHQMGKLPFCTGDEDIIQRLADGTLRPHLA